MKFRNRIVKCAFCGKNSEQRELMSSSSFGDADLDTRPAGIGRNSFAFEISECPHCHYCNFTIDTQNALPTAFSDEYLNLANSSVYTRVAVRYWLAALLYEAEKDNQLIGSLYLSAAWAFDDANDIESANIARKNAANYFTAYVDDTSDGDVLLILIDVLRRVGSFDMAIKWLDEVGEVDDEEINNVLRFQRKKCIDGDSGRYTFGDVENA